VKEYIEKLLLFILRTWLRSVMCYWCRSESADRNWWRHDAVGPKWTGKRFHFCSQLTSVAWLVLLFCYLRVAAVITVWLRVRIWCDV